MDYHTGKVPFLILTLLLHFTLAHCGLINSLAAYISSFLLVSFLGRGRELPAAFQINSWGCRASRQINKQLNDVMNREFVKTFGN